MSGDPVLFVRLCQAGLFPQRLARLTHRRGQLSDKVFLDREVRIDRTQRLTPKYETLPTLGNLIIESERYKEGAKKYDPPKYDPS